MVKVRDLSHIRIDLLSFESAGGIVRGLFYHAGRPSTCVVLCHGYSSSKHNVDPLAFHLAVDGFSAFAFDFLGHKLGASTGPLRTGADLAENALDAVALVRSLPGVEHVVIGGHSMGAATSIGAATRSPAIEAVIAMATSLDRGRVLTDAGMLSGLQNRAAYVDGAPPDEIALAMDEFTSHVAEIAPRPLLVIAGSKDGLVGPSAVRRLFDAAREPKTFELIDANHTDCAERSRFAVSRWLKARGFANS
ncbi:MAG TPA: alpha/beta fold hydrolase [Candidatus Eremiobacteraceae bacterium]|nr:alpha/beta fold hydrolase [Candidatus Eremiobacteraceae bacterium]